MAVTDDKRGGRMDRGRLALEIRRSAGPAGALLALIILALLSIGIIFANIGISLPWDTNYSRQIMVDSAKGVQTGDTVRLSGVVVGRITKINLVNDKAILNIEMGNKYGPLYNDASLTLRPETPLDDMYLDITNRGNPKTGQLPANTPLNAKRTQTPVDISNVLDIFNADVRTRVKEQIDSLGVGLGPVQGQEFEEALVQLAPFLNAAKQLTYQTAIRQRETRTLISNFQKITAELGNRTVQVRQLVTSGASSLTQLGSHQGQIEAVIDQLPGTMRQIQSTFTTLRNTENHLDPALTALEPVTKVLPTALTDLTNFSKSAAPAFAKLDQPLPVLNDMMKQLSPTAASLNTTLKTLKPVPDELNDITKLVEPCEPALADFFQNTLSVGAYSSNLSTIVRGEAVVGASSAAGGPKDQVKPTSCAPGAGS